MGDSWISAIGRRLATRPRVDEGADPAKFPTRSGPPGTQHAPQISDSLRSTYAERKREALIIADRSAAEFALGPPGRAEAAIAKVAAIAHQLAGSAAYFDEAELGRVAAAVDDRLRAASADNRSAIVDTIAEFRAALVASDTRAPETWSRHPRHGLQKG